MHKTTRSASALFFAAILVMPFVAEAARPLGPPLAELTSGYHIVMAARAVERTEPGRVRFERISGYYGDPAESIVLRTGESDESFIEIGEVYILAYTLVTYDSQFREVKFEDPEGPKIAKIRGVDDRAVFAETPELQFLFEQAVDEQPAEPRKVLDALLTQMQRSDERALSLVVTELLLRPDLIAIVDADDGRVISQVVASDDVPMQTRDFLLQVAPRFDKAATEDWLVAAQRSIVRTAPVEFDLVSPMPSLVRTAVRGLKATGDASDLPALRPLLASNAPGVAKAALDTMDGLDPDATLKLARQVQSDESLLAETRRVVALYIKQRDKQAAARGS